jgi:hypothetical protein
MERRHRSNSMLSGGGWRERLASSAAAIYSHLSFLRLVMVEESSGTASITAEMAPSTAAGPLFASIALASSSADGDRLKRKRKAQLLCLLVVVVVLVRLLPPWVMLLRLTILLPPRLSTIHQAASSGRRHQPALLKPLHPQHLPVRSARVATFCIAE